MRPILSIVEGVGGDGCYFFDFEVCCWGETAFFVDEMPPKSSVLGHSEPSFRIYYLAMPKKNATFDKIKWRVVDKAALRKSYFWLGYVLQGKR